MPRVSIGMPIYNGEKHVRETIDSILGQSYGDFELIITDNASTDGTGEICREYAVKDSRVRYIRNDRNIGAAANFNLAFLLSRGGYFKWAAHDDVLHRDFLASCVDVLDRDSTVVLCFTRVVGIGLPSQEYDFDNEMEFDAPRAHRRFRKLMDMRHWCIAVFGLFRAGSLRNTPLIGNYVGSDRCLVAEIGLVGVVYRVPEFLFFHRIHPAMSCLAYSDPQERWGWFDPTKAGKICLPNWRYGLEFARSVRKTPLGLSDRILCYLHIAGWYRKRTKFLYRDVRGAVRHQLRRTRAGRSLDSWLFFDVTGALRLRLRRTAAGRVLEKWLFPDLKKVSRDILVRFKVGRDLLHVRRQVLKWMGPDI